MRIIVAPDSYKGSLSAVEAARIMADAIRTELPQAEVEVFPMADGGEGTVEAVLSGTGGRRVELSATGPLGSPVNTYYGIIGKCHDSNDKPDDAVMETNVMETNVMKTGVLKTDDLKTDGLETAVMETAAVAGLTLVPPEQRNPLFTTTYGLGECIRHALDRGIRRFLIGLGGSATNDGGLGMLQALGASFYDKQGNRLPDFKPGARRPAPCHASAASAAKTSSTVTAASTLNATDAFTPNPVTELMFRIARVDFGTLDARLQETEIVIASDVQSPLCGPQGASAVFGPQKGATPEQVRLLDEALAYYADKVEQHLGRTYRLHPGAGAAGGLGFAFLCLGGQICSGARLVIQASGLADRLPDSHWLITGEGKTDAQTLLGKLPVILADTARSHGVRTVLVSGCLTGDEKTLDELYRRFDAIFAIPNRPMTLEEAMRDVRPLLKTAARNVARLIARASSHKN